MWSEGLFTSPQKKALLRSLIEKVVAYREAGDKIHIRVVWRGGLTTEGYVTVGTGKIASMERGKELEQRVLDLSKDSTLYTTEIAKLLTAEGFHSPQSDEVLVSTVRTIRKRNGIMDLARSSPTQVPGFLTTAQLEARLGLRQGWIFERIRTGKILVEKDPETGRYLFPDTESTVNQIRLLSQGKLKSVVTGGASR